MYRLRQRASAGPVAEALRGDNAINDCGFRGLVAVSGLNFPAPACGSGDFKSSTSSLVPATVDIQRMGMTPAAAAVVIETK
jgi:hypothetical protein